MRVPKFRLRAYIVRARPLPRLSGLRAGPSPGFFLRARVPLPVAPARRRDADRRSQGLGGPEGDVDPHLPTTLFRWRR